MSCVEPRASHSRSCLPVCPPLKATFRLGPERITHGHLPARSGAEHSIDFRILAAESGWEERALRGVYLSSILEALKDKLIVLEDRTLEDLIALSI